MEENPTWELPRKSKVYYIFAAEAERKRDQGPSWQMPEHPLTR